MRRLLVISLLLNGVLFALVARRALQEADLAFAREPRMQMTQRGSLHATRHAPGPILDSRTPATPWSVLEAREDPFGPSDPESQARRQELEREKAAAVAAILTPAEYEGYQMWESPAARYVRSSLPAAKSEAEFRAMVKVAAEFDLGSNPVGAAARYGLAPDDPEEGACRRVDSRGNPDSMTLHSRWA